MTRWDGSSDSDRVKDESENTNHLPDPRVFLLEAVPVLTTTVHEHLHNKSTHVVTADC